MANDRRPTTFGELAEVLDTLQIIVLNARRARHLSQRELARQAGLSFQHRQPDRGRRGVLVGQPAGVAGLARQTLKGAHSMPTTTGRRADWTSSLRFHCPNRRPTNSHRPTSMIEVSAVADRNEALNAAVLLLGPDRGHAILGCDWGTRVALPDDREVCIDQARRRIAVHGVEPEPLLLQLCDAHAGTVMAETDPHAGGEPRG